MFISIDNAFINIDSVMFIQEDAIDKHKIVIGFNNGQTVKAEVKNRKKIMSAINKKLKAANKMLKGRV